MIILHIAPIYMTRVNGFRFSVPGLISAQNKIKGVYVGLMNIKEKNLINKNETEEYDFSFFESYSNIENLPEPYNKPDIIVFHGIYFAKYIKFYKYITREKIPYVIVPRVSLTNGAQKQNKYKKTIANALFFNNFIRDSEAINYLTENEKFTSSKFQKKNFIVGNGINIPDEIVKSDYETIKMVYIGRYDINHKGLDILISALKKIKRELVELNVEINFFGSDYRNGKKYLENNITANNMTNTVKINDAILGPEKHLILQKSDIFILTSRFEGHPMAAIEAMAYGIPCIITQGTNLVEIVSEYDAGWSTELESDEISKTILNAIKSKADVIVKGKNAKKLVQQNYTWSKIAKQTLAQYEELISKL